MSTINQIASSTYRDTHKGLSNLQLQTREANKKIEAAADLQKSIPGKHTIISAISFAKLTELLNITCFKKNLLLILFEKLQLCPF